MAREKTKATTAAEPRPIGTRAKGRKVVSMRLIISAVTATLIALSVIGFGNLAERNTRQTLGQEIEGRLIIEARNLASLSANALLTDFPELTLCPLVSEIQQGRQDLAFVAVLDHEGKIQGHIDLEMIGQELEMVEGMRPRPTTRHLLPGEQVLATVDLVLVSVPARHGNGREVGTAVVGLSQSYLDEMVARPRRAFLILTTILLVIGVGVTLAIMSALLRPIGALRAGLERIGQGDLASPIDLQDKTELGLLAETVNGMADQLLQSREQMLEKERLGAEMSLAHQMQHALLPEDEIRCGEFLCKGKYQAAAEVGGDYYDTFEMEDGKLGLVIADVSGKGLAGCLVTSMLAVLIRSLRNQYCSPREMLINLEKGLQTSLRPGTFVTVFYGILDPGSGRLVFASAAHSPLAVLRAETKEVAWYYTKGIPLGAMRNGVLAGTLQDQEIVLEPGDLALQFTDGLNEAWNPRCQEQFDFDRIAEHLVTTAGRGCATVMDELLPMIEAWTAPEPLGDDFTLLAVERVPVPSPSGENDPDTTASGVGTAAGREDLADMLAGTMQLQLRSRMSELTVIRKWVREILAGQKALSGQQDLIESSLFEVCANIIEHGYGGDEQQSIDLWWVPLPPGRQSPRQVVEIDGTEPDSPGLARDGVGYFLICDQGKTFDPTGWTPPNYNDPTIRRKGRGLGWHIIYSSMKKVEYEPMTPAGNLTLLRFDPTKDLVR